MTRTRITLILILFGFSIAACRGKPPCLDCEDKAADDDDGIWVPDLPCGGANLMTDNLNCGTCGHVCDIWYEGTEYEAGACNEGECGPIWSDCVIEGTEKTCSDICAGFNRTCMANGCSGKTGMISDVLFGQGCGDIPPVLALTGGCDEPIPWMTPVEYGIEVSCCCDNQ